MVLDKGSMGISLIYSISFLQLIVFCTAAEQTAHLENEQDAGVGLHSPGISVERRRIGAARNVGTYSTRYTPEQLRVRQRPSRGFEGFDDIRGALLSSSGVVEDVRPDDRVVSMNAHYRTRSDTLPQLPNDRWLGKRNMGAAMNMKSLRVGQKFKPH